ncbi:hypothetical protein ACLB2K_020684 [Fragaria x ananassa]
MVIALPSYYWSYSDPAVGLGFASYSSQSPGLQILDYAPFQNNFPTQLVARCDENGLSNQARCDLWCPPLPSEVKINIDGVWKSSDLTSGIGIIVRNHRGSSIAGASLHGSHNSAIEVEADAALRAFQLAAHLRLQNIVIESDCQDIIRL